MVRQHQVERSASLESRLPDPGHSTFTAEDEAYPLNLRLTTARWRDPRYDNRTWTDIRYGNLNSVSSALNEPGVSYWARLPPPLYLSP